MLKKLYQLDDTDKVKAGNSNNTDPIDLSWEAPVCGSFNPCNRCGIRDGKDDKGNPIEITNTQSHNKSYESWKNTVLL
ncbi:MAG: hypothetical protein GY765_32645 [bacterium]|nr:hypothetical protein [bacterium]